MLINRGVQLDSQTECGKTALHFAVSHVSTDCIRLLVKGGCDLNIQVLYNRLVILRKPFCIIFFLRVSMVEIQDCISPFRAGYLHPPRKLLFRS